MSIKSLIVTVVFILLCWVIWRYGRYFFDPALTEEARKNVILEALRGLDFETLSKGRERAPLEFHGRKLSYHWDVQPMEIDGVQGIVLEFDVHPSTLPITTSASEFIFIRDRDHLTEIKKHLSQSEDYTSYCVSPSARWIRPHTG